LQRSGEATIAACLTVAGLGVSTVFGLLSSEGILHFDDLTHYLYANWAWQWPAYLLDEWGRPGFTALYFLPARFGWAACRGVSALLTAGSAWLAFRIAQRMGLRHAWAAVLLCYAQPLFFQLSQTTLTETPLAFYLTAGVYLAQRGRWSCSAALLSLGFVTRHEAIIFLPVWVFFAWREGVKPWRLWPILWAPLVVNALASLAGLQPTIYRLLEPEPSGQYGHGGWLTFFCRSMEAWGPGVMVLAMVGLAPAWKKGRGGRLVVTCVVAYFSVQTVIRALGLFDSGGYARFLVAVSPLVAVTALVGWQQLWATRLRRRRAAWILTAASMILLWLAMERQLVLHEAKIDQAAELPQLYRAKIAVRTATAAMLLLAAGSLATMAVPGVARRAQGLVPAGVVALILLASYGLCHPLTRPPEAEIIDELQAWLAEHEFGDRVVISANVWLDFATGRRLPPGRPSVRAYLERAEPGTLFAWDRQFAAAADHDLQLEEFTGSRAFRLIHATRPAPYQEQPYLRVFEKTAPWGPSAGRTAPGNAHRSAF
jgi:hypothetical protein